MSAPSGLDALPMGTSHCREKMRGASPAAVLVLCFGCALMPGVPAGPITAPGLRLDAGYAHAYAPATAHATEPSGASRTLHGNSAMHLGSRPAILPAHVGFRVAPRRWFDLGVDLGLQDSGTRVRAGPLDASQDLPWGIELEWRTGLTNLAGADELAYRRNILRSRVEAYPALPFGRSESGVAYAFGVLGLGLSTGTQLSSMNEVPANDDTFLVFSGASLDWLRWETRLEAALGLQWLRQPDAYMLVFLPWYRLHQGRLREVNCSACSLDVSSIDSSWGFGLALHGSWRIE